MQTITACPVKADFRHLSLNEILDTLGYTTKKAGESYRKVILDEGVQVFEGTAHEVTNWLRQQHPGVRI